MTPAAPTTDNLQKRIVELEVERDLLACLLTEYSSQLINLPRDCSKGKKHRTVPIVIAGRTVEIDEDIAPLVEVMNQVGIVTHQSCQEMWPTNRAWFDLDCLGDLELLLSLVAANAEPTDPIKQSLGDYCCPPYDWAANPLLWDYHFSPQVLDNGCIEWHVVVEIPRQCIRLVTERLVEANVALHDVLKPAGAPA